MLSTMIRAASWGSLLCLCALCALSCGEEEAGPGISVLLYTPQAAELSPIPPTLTRLRFSAIQADTRDVLSSATVSLSSGSADLSGIPYGENLQIVVEGLDDLDAPIMRGMSTPFSFFDDSPQRRVPVLMMELERFSTAAALAPGLDGELTVLPVGFEAAQARAGHSVTRLDSGRLLFVGGATLSGEEGFDFPWIEGDLKLQRVLRTVELYDPSTGTFLQLPEMRFERAFHTTTLLDDGRVLVVGGVTIFEKDDGPVVETVKPAEIFDPATQAWTVISGDAAPRLARAWHSAVQRKLDGKVIIAGGRGISDGSAGVLDTAEVFNPDTLMFESNAGGELIQLSVPRADHTAVLSAAPGPGRGSDVMLIGGRNEAGVLGSIETVRAVNSNSRFEAEVLLPPLRTPRHSHASLRVTPEDGSLILIAGGIGEDGTLGTIEILDVAAGQVAMAGSMGSPRSHAQLVELPQTLQVMVLGGANGGESLSSAEKLTYREDTGRYTAQPIGAVMESPRYLHTASLLTNGLILMTGGVGSRQESLDTVEVFNPDDGSPGSQEPMLDEDGFVIP